jgi:hypothetical protein
MTRSNAAAAISLGLLVAFLVLPTVAQAAAAKPDAKRTQVASPDPAKHERREGHPRVYLSWDAPWGMPRARDTVMVACDDTTRADTLYLTFDPGQDLAELLGIDASLTFRAAPGDSLGPFWDLSRRGVNPWNLRIEFDEPPAGAESPWQVSGMGAPAYKLNRDSARLELTYYINAAMAAPVAAGTRYFFARVMIRERRPYLRGCKQPVCVELNRLIVSYSGGRRWMTTGERFVSWNSPGGHVCDTFKLLPPEPEPAPLGGAPPDSSRN